MTPAQMSLIHGRAFVAERGWTEAEISDLLASPYCHTFTATHGFAICRTLAGETELLTLAVDPEAQRQGTAKMLMTQWIAASAAHAQTAFLEVAADNHAALALYYKHAFQRSGLRKGYYARADAEAVDAVLMSRALTQG